MKLKKGIAVLLMMLLLVLGVVGCASKSTSESSEKVIKIGTSGGYKPYTFMNEEGKLDGFEIDVWNEIAKRIGYKVEFTASEFSGLFGMLETKKIDTISNQITITDERKQKYVFSNPYVYDGAQLVVKKGNETIKSLEDLKGKKVGVNLGSNYEEIVRTFDKNNEIEVVTYEEYVGAPQDVSLGRIDAVLDDKIAGLESVKKSGLDLQLGGEPVEKLENAFPFLNTDENKELITKVNKAIEDMKKDGTFEKISKKWLEIDITKE